jgi:hypothetical protein
MSAKISPLPKVERGNSAKYSMANTVVEQMDVEMVSPVRQQQGLYCIYLFVLLSFNTNLTLLHVFENIASIYTLV